MDENDRIKMNDIDRNELRSKLQIHSNDANREVATCYGSELRTRQYLIDPFIRNILNYNPSRSAEVELEYAVGNASGRADYALMNSDANNGKKFPVIFIEAKPANNNKIVSEYKQIWQYGQLDNSVVFLALTNGIKWFWYKKDETRHVHTKERIMEWSEPLEPFLEFNIDDISDTILPFFYYIGKSSKDETPEKEYLNMALKWADQHVIENNVRRWLENWIRQQSESDTADTEFLNFLLEKMRRNNIKATTEEAKKIFPSVFGRFRPWTNYSSNEVDRDLDLTIPDGAFILDTTITVPTEHGGNVTLCQSTDKFKRVWKITSDTYWKVEATSAKLCVKVVQHFGKMHEQGNESYYEKLVKQCGQYVIIREQLPQRTNFRGPQNLTENGKYLLNTAYGSHQKRVMLSELARFVKEDGKSSIEDFVQIWLP